MSALITSVDDNAFEDVVLNATMPVLVDFWAPWCGPCKAIAPILEEIAPRYSSRVKIVKINVDDNNQTPAEYGVRGIPTLMLFKDGEVAATKVGAMTAGQLAAFLDENV